MNALFISDLHLDASRPDISERFSVFLRDGIADIDALYILGDLFEAWLGDDAADDELCTLVAGGLSRLSRSNIAVYFMHGNRDFLLGQKFAQRCGMRILADPTVIQLQGEPTLLLHGDTLCTDDVAYQSFREQVRRKDWQSRFLQQTVAQRRDFAAQARAASRQHQKGLDSEIMDVNPSAVARTLKQFGVRRMIHGHTHRPAIHHHGSGMLDGVRIVLGDWYEQGSSLRVTPDSIALQSF
jgi:UDP-2,3-diacylglucosamine hydrolase